jgi:PKD repeat protein
MMHTALIALLLFMLLLCACAGGSSITPALSAGAMAIHPPADELAALNALPTPAGVDPRRFAALKAALRATLLGHGALSQPPGPPVGPAGKVADLHFSGAALDHLAWTYANQGDYDQNGEVSVTDITPLGKYLGRNAASADWLSAACTADGDANGEVNPSDITPLGQHLHAQVEVYRVQQTQTPEAAASWTTVLDVPLNTGQPASGARLGFDVALPSNIGHAFLRVVPLAADQTGAASTVLEFSLGPHVSKVLPQDGICGTKVTFVPTLSGPAADSFAWDFGGAATPTTADIERPAVTLAGTPGSFHCTLTVSNSSGTQQFGFEVKLTANQPPTAAFTAAPGQGHPGATVTLDASASLDADGYLVTYEWDLNGDTVYETSHLANPHAETHLPASPGERTVRLRVTDDAGATDEAEYRLLAYAPGWLVVSVDPAGGGTTALAEIAGHPGIAYFNSSTNSLQFASTTSDDGAGDWQTHAVCPMGTAAVSVYNCALAEVAGAGGIAFYDNARQDLRYAAAKTPSGSLWDVFDVDTAGDQGHFPSLASLGGKPGICYAGAFQQGRRVRFANGTAANGSSWHTQNLDAVDCTCTALTLVAGFPAVAYCADEGQGHFSLRYARSTAANGSSGWSPFEVTTLAQAADAVGLLGLSSGPGLVWPDSTAGQLRFGSTPAVAGSGNWTTTPVDSLAAASSLALGLAVVDGKPAAAYFLPTTGLHYAQSASADGSGNWPAAVLPGQDAAGRGCSVAQIGGLPAISFLGPGGSGLKYAVFHP